MVSVEENINENKSTLIQAYSIIKELSTLFDIPLDTDTSYDDFVQACINKM